MGYEVSKVIATESFDSFSTGAMKKKTIMLLDPVEEEEVESYTLDHLRQMYAEGVALVYPSSVTFLGSMLSKYSFFRFFLR